MACVTTKFRRLMTHSGTIIRRVKGVSGSMTDQSTTASQPCFFEYNRRRSVNRQGEEVTTNAVLFLPADNATYDHTHEYWEFIDAGDPARRLQQVNVRRIDDPRTGQSHHYEIDLI